MIAVAPGRALRLLACLFLTYSATSAGAQSPTGTYEPVLRYIEAEYAPKPLVLYSTVLRLECYRGGCEEPWAGTLPQPWLVEIRSRGLISDDCAFGNDRCVRPDGSPVVGADGVYVMLSTQRSCGEGCADVLASHTLVRDETTVRRYMLYRLVLGRDGWVVQSVHDGGKVITG